MPLYITLWFVELSSFKFSGITRFIILLKNQLQIRFTTQIYPFLQNRSRQKWEEEKDKFINYTWMRAGNCRCLGFNEWRIAYVKNENVSECLSDHGFTQLLANIEFHNIVSNFD